jgi:heterodisulfide reductase subunit A
VVLAPADETELAHLSPRSGIFVCLPGQDAEMIGAAVAAKVGATLGSGRVVAVENIAHVNPARCRACGTCESVCEFAAITVSELGNRLCAQVDPLVCQGCGACAAHCPSSAIAAGYSTDQQIAAMLEAILGGG